MYFLSDDMGNLIKYTIDYSIGVLFDNDSNRVRISFCALSLFYLF